MIITLLIDSTCCIVKIETKGIELVVFSRVNFDTILNLTLMQTQCANKALEFSP